MSDESSAPQQLDLALLRDWPLPVDEDGDKFRRGTVLVIGGSASTPGAVVLAGMAALRMGAGRLQIATDPSAVPAVAVAVPEARVQAFGGEDLGDRIAAADSVVIGPGLLDEQLATALVRSALRTASEEAIVVIDALAMRGLCAIEEPAWDRMWGRLVLTPNRQELEALVGEVFKDDEHLDGDDLVTAAAQRCGAVVTSFGTIAAPDGRRWETSAGHPSLGTSGSGDVLAGLVAGAAARTGDGAQSACWGTLAHLLAGERLGARNHQLGFLARELIDEVGPAIAADP